MYLDLDVLFSFIDPYEPGPSNSTDPYEPGPRPTGWWWNARAGGSVVQDGRAGRSGGQWADRSGGRTGRLEDAR